jgi:hypothetical protein
MRRVDSCSSIGNGRGPFSQGLRSLRSSNLPIATLFRLADQTGLVASGLAIDGGRYTPSRA